MEKLERPKTWPPGTIEELCALLAWANATAEEAIRKAGETEREVRTLLRVISTRAPTARP